MRQQCPAVQGKKTVVRNFCSLNIQCDENQGKGTAAGYIYGFLLVAAGNGVNGVTVRHFSDQLLPADQDNNASEQKRTMKLHEILVQGRMEVSVAPYDHIHAMQSASHLELEDEKERNLRMADHINFNLEPKLENREVLSRPALLSELVRFMSYHNHYKGAPWHPPSVEADTGHRLSSSRGSDLLRGNKLLISLKRNGKSGSQEAEGRECSSHCQSFSGLLWGAIFLCTGYLPRGADAYSPFFFHLEAVDWPDSDICCICPPVSTTGQFWYTYSVIPAFGAYNAFGLIKALLSRDSEGMIEDEKTRKKREKMEKGFKGAKL
ncbi:hypothetical protein Ancab_019942 [Ancistrocladus abbreviatus]